MSDLSFHYLHFVNITTNKWWQNTTFKPIVIVLQKNPGKCKSYFERQLIHEIALILRNSPQKMIPVLSGEAKRKTLMFLPWILHSFLNLWKAYESELKWEDKEYELKFATLVMNYTFWISADIASIFWWQFFFIGIYTVVVLPRETLLALKNEEWLRMNDDIWQSKETRHFLQGWKVISVWSDRFHELLCVCYLSYVKSWLVNGVSLRSVVLGTWYGGRQSCTCIIKPESSKTSHKQRTTSSSLLSEISISISSSRSCSTSTWISAFIKRSCWNQTNQRSEPLIQQYAS